jgi:hypothetical protein
MGMRNSHQLLFGVYRCTAILRQFTENERTFVVSQLETDRPYLPAFSRISGDRGRR